MTDKEKEAYNFFKKCNEKDLENFDYFSEPSKLQIKYMETVLNLTQTQQEEIRRYEKIYKEYGIDDLVRKIERLEEENEELKRLANNKQWISPCYVAHNYIPKSKAREMLKELLKKLDEPNNDRWEKDDDIYYNKIKAQIRIIQELMEEK